MRMRLVVVARGSVGRANGVFVTSLPAAPAAMLRAFAQERCGNRPGTESGTEPQLPKLQGRT